MEIKEGHLYGNLIDILKNGAPIMLLAIGMTLVIATHGIDISVGSLVAISARSCSHSHRRRSGRPPQIPPRGGHAGGPGGMQRGGHVERDAGLKDRHAAHHCDADPLCPRARHRHAVHELNADLAVCKTVRHPGAGLRRGPPVRYLHCGIGSVLLDLGFHADPALLPRRLARALMGVILDRQSAGIRVEGRCGLTSASARRLGGIKWRTRPATFVP